MRKVLLALLLVAAAIGACTALLPERYAVNAPMAHLLLGRGTSSPSDDVVHERLRAPDGLVVQLFARDLPNVRMLLSVESGDLVASQTREGRVVLLERDHDGDGRSDSTRVLLEGLDRPHGLALRDGFLWIAENGSVGRIRFDPAARRTQGELERVVSGLPRDGQHSTRTIGFGPDGMLYVSVGSSCNVCKEADPRRAAILRYRPDGSGEEIYASGLRNSVDFDWQPGTDALYATDNGRDFLGDDSPPCELDRIERGGFYGWPIANGDRVPDPDFGKGQEERIRGSHPPAFPFRAHNAPLGIRFVRGENAPASLRGAALVALHGSWNRTKKDGYKVVSLHWDGSGAITQRDFLVGFEQDENVIGRPVDAAEGPDGVIYVSDDYAGAVYSVAPR